MDEMPFQRATRYIADHVEEVLEQVDPKQVEAFAEEVRQARHVILFGMGRSGLVAKTFTIRLAHLGLDAYVVGETTTPPIDQRDLVVLVSGTGETYSVVLTGQIARDLEAPVACITADPGSRLARLSDMVIELNTDLEDDDERARLAPLGTLFEDTALLFFDGVIAHLMDVMGETENDMRGRHSKLE